MENTIEIYTDGACQPNPGQGGYGAVLKFNGRIKITSGSIGDTTNNRAELTAVKEALLMISCKKYFFNVVIYSDSKYIVDAISKNWIVKWKKNNFKGKKNVDLWKSIIKLLNMNKSYLFIHIPRNSCKEHALADELAKNAINLKKYL